MPFTKIVPADLQGKGVIGQPAVPGLSVTEMQESVEQIVREVAIPAVNRLVDELGATTAAGNIGAVVPDGLSAEPTVQDVVSAIHEAANSGKDEVAGDLEQHKSNTSNPHAVTAAQTGAYTKEETEAAIDAKVVQIGAADMAKSVYDPTHQERDIFSAISVVQAAAQAATSRTYTAVLPASGWTGSASAGYTQTVSCEGMTADVVTLPPAIQPTGVRETDIAQREALGYISMVETLEGQVTVTCWEDKPTVDLTVYLVEAR